MSASLNLHRRKGYIPWKGKNGKKTLPELQPVHAPPEWLARLISAAARNAERMQDARHPIVVQFNPQKPKTPPPEPPKLPTRADLAKNFLTATVKWAAKGFPVVTQEQYEARMAICETCEYWDATARLGAGKCSHKKCGCTRFKHWLATEQCPIAKWPTLNTANPTIKPPLKTP